MGTTTLVSNSNPQVAKKTKLQKRQRKQVTKKTEKVSERWRVLRSGRWRVCDASRRVGAKRPRRSEKTEKLFLKDSQKDRERIRHEDYRKIPRNILRNRIESSI